MLKNFYNYETITRLHVCLCWKIKLKKIQNAQRFVVIYLVFVMWKLTWTQSFTAHMPNFKESGTAMSALGNTALMGTEKIPSYE